MFHSHPDYLDPQSPHVPEQSLDQQNISQSKMVPLRSAELSRSKSCLDERGGFNNLFRCFSCLLYLEPILIEGILKILRRE